MHESYAQVRHDSEPRRQSMERLLIGGLLLLTLVSRLFLSGAGTLPGDMNYWVRWSEQLTRGGLRSFYARSGADYLPIYPYILWLLGKLYTPLQHLAASGAGWTISRDTLYKLPAIFADVATVYLIYTAGRRWATPLAAGIAATVYATNPAIIANSARWGQVDSIPACLMLLALVLLIEERPILCGIALSLSVMTKPTALVLIPLIGVVLLRRRQLAGLAYLCVSFLLTSLAIVWPFVPTGIDVPQFVEQRFGVTTSTWSYATMNAFNLWALRQHNVMKVPDSQTWMGLTLHLWGWLFLGCLAIAVCVIAAIFMPDYPEGRARVILPAACLLTFGFFMLLTRIHERHLLPVLPLLALTCTVWPRFWPFYVWLSIAYLLNLHFAAPGIFALPEPLLGQAEVPIVSALNLAALIGMTALTAVTITHSVATLRWAGRAHRWAGMAQRWAGRDEAHA